jgi:hypothetical protein
MFRVSRVDEDFEVASLYFIRFICQCVIVWMDGWSAVKVIQREMKGRGKSRSQVDSQVDDCQRT